MTNIQIQRFEKLGKKLHGNLPKGVCTKMIIARPNEGKKDSGERARTEKRQKIGQKVKKREKESKREKEKRKERLKKRKRVRDRNKRK